MEVERERDEPPEQLTPELGHDPLTHDPQQVGLQEAAGGLDAEQRDQHDDQPIKARAVAAGDDFRGDPRDDQREGEAKAGTDDESDQRDRERTPVRSKVTEEPPPRHAAKATNLPDDGAGV